MELNSSTMIEALSYITMIVGKGSLPSCLRSDLKIDSEFKRL
jgi:hypothetical protein